MSDDVNRDQAGYDLERDLPETIRVIGVFQEQVDEMADVARWVVDRLNGGTSSMPVAGECVDFAAALDGVREVSRPLSDAALSEQLPGSQLRGLKEALPMPQPEEAWPAKEVQRCRLR